MTRELNENEYINQEDGFIYCSICGQPKEKIYHYNAFDEDRCECIKCRCEIEKEEREKHEEEEREKRMHIERIRQDGMRDEKLRKCTFDNDKGFCSKMDIARKYVEEFETLKQGGNGLLLWGPPGSGKTFFAACIANALIDREISVYMTNFSTVINTLTGMFSEEKNKFISDISSKQLLVIDDLGIERNTEYALEQVYNVIDTRYRSGKPMIVTTNIALDDMENPKDLMHKRIFDRVLEVCTPILINGKNIRDIKTEENNKIVGKTIKNSEGMVKRNE